MKSAFKKLGLCFIVYLLSESFYMFITYINDGSFDGYIGYHQRKYMGGTKNVSRKKTRKN